jgi:SAM-dependent methyltransferase
VRHGRARGVSAITAADDRPADRARDDLAYGSSPMSVAGSIHRRVTPLTESDAWQRFWAHRHTRHFARSMDRHVADFGRAVLPPFYGFGLTERAVEFGWVRHHLVAGDVLDAGSALNHEVTLERVLAQVSSLTVVTLAPEERSWPERGVHYLYQDLRHLDIADASFDMAVSISTLEHVGLDNSRFYGSDAPAGDPNQDAQQAMRELRRVVKPGGTLLITVPFGTSWRNDWVRTFDGDELDALVASVDPVATDETIFRRRLGAWQRATRTDASNATYRGFWSEAVACVRISLPGDTGIR